MKQIILKDSVGDTYTNIAGTSLAIQLKPFIIKGEVISVSLTDSSPISSSFFNSSFGELIEEFGFQKVRNSIKIIGVTASQGELLTKYFNAYKKHDHC